VAYAVTVTVQPRLVNRNRLTTAFRLILGIPHVLLVGGIGLSLISNRADLGLENVRFGSETGLLGAVAGLLAIVSWFTIVFTGQHIIGIRQLTAFYLRWRVRALAYMMLLEDQYPPFGDAPYPASIEIVDPIGPRDRLTVGLRILLAIPHFIVLGVLVFIWWLSAIVAWLLILFTAEYPRGLYDFGTGTLRWLLRVEAYLLLMVDDYPPFSLS
jgi:hypothetical protein